MPISRPSRRQILDGLAAIGVALALPRARAWAQEPAANPGRIDVHHHYVSPRWLAALDKNYQVPGLDTFKQYSTAASIESLDRAGVTHAVLSTTTPGVWFGDNAEARDLARDMNDFGAKLVADHKGRFRLFAVLPLPDVEASLREIDYAYGTLKADGISVLSSYGTKWLGDPSFAPVWDELNRRKALVFSHATVADCCKGLMPNIDPVIIELNTDTSRTIVSLIENETASRYPDIRFIFSHAGGTIPSLAGRYLHDQANTDKLNAAAAPNSKLDHLRRFYYHTAGSANPVQMQSLKMIVSASQILYGTDFPWGDPAKIAVGLRGCGFTEAELRGIDRENVLKLLPQLST
jgi:predicted TIM-barrel fold metal-dependent hydrolase